MPIKKVWLSLFILFLFVIVQVPFQNVAKAQEVSNDLNSNSISLKDFLVKVEKKFQITFLYKNEVLKGKYVDRDRVTLKNAGALDSFLSNLFAGFVLTYKKIDNETYIILNENDVPQRSNAAFSIAGKIQDAATGQKLSGVNIIVKGTAKGAYSDKQGKYSLPVLAKQDSLIFSYIGYKSKTIPIAGKRNINVTLQPELLKSSGIIVVGYGKQKIKDITGSIFSINTEEFSSHTIGDLQASLEGKATGVQITQNSGSPGNNAKVRVRGLTSINNSAPIYVVDGIPLTANSINNINPNNVESVEVLKDASAQSIYGSRGANGVILIETKRGSDKKSYISVDVSQGIQQVHKKLNMLNSQNYVKLNTEAYENAGLQSPWDEPENYTHTTDWQDAIFCRAPVSNYNIAFGGGNKTMTYRLSGGYFNRKGIIIGSDYRRVSMRLNTTFKPLKNFKLGEHLSITKTNRHIVGEGNGNRINIVSALKMDPTVPVKNKNGAYSSPRYSDAVNPVASIHYIHKNNPFNNIGLLGNVEAVYQPAESISLKTSYSVDIGFSDDQAFLPSYDVAPNLRNPIPSLSHTKSVGTNWTWNNTITVQPYLGDFHHIKFLGGISAERYSFNYLYGSNQGQAGNEHYLRYLDAGISNAEVNGREAAWSLLSFIGRLNYDYKKTYFLTATIRRDGSSKFATNHKYGNFPAVSAGWILTNERFLQNQSFLSYLKVRGSWGIVGNQAGAGYYDFSSLINNSYYAFGKSPREQLATEPDQIDQNPNLKWEEVRQWNIGFNFRFWDNKLAGTFDYYNKKTKDMLLAIPIMSESGYQNGPLTNAASMVNSGFEWAINYSSVLGNDLSLDAGFNISTLHNEILSLNNKNARIQNGPNVTTVGHRAAEFYGYVFNGIFQNEEEVQQHAYQQGAAPGDIRFKDINGDGIINNNDQTFLGTPIPKIAYGFHLKGDFKNIDFNMSWAGVYGNKIYRQYKYHTDGFFVSNYNMEKEALNRWHGEGTSNRIPRLNANDPNNNARISSFYLADGSYLRLRNVTVGYSLPKKIVDKLNCEKLRFFISGQNLLTLTSYDGYGPEIGIQYGGRSGTLNLGVDHGTYPQPQVISGGFNIEF